MITLKKKVRILSKKVRMGESDILCEKKREIEKWKREKERERDNVYLFIPQRKH